MLERDFAQVVAEGRALQRQFSELGLVAVGGTSVALHCGHRISLDVDEVTPRLQDCYQDIVSALERWEDWTTLRLNPPVLILGERHSVELGLRQQRRSVRLRTTEIEGLVVPTLAEALRIKAFLLAERRATRDYVDVAALVQRFGQSAALDALALLNLLYPSRGPQTLTTRFAEACESEPLDLAAIPLSSYKSLKAPFTEWDFVASVCQRLGRELLKLELQNALPQRFGEEFREEAGL